MHNYDKERCLRQLVLSQIACRAIDHLTVLVATFIVRHGYLAVAEAHMHAMVVSWSETLSGSACAIYEPPRRESNIGLQ